MIKKHTLAIRFSNDFDVSSLSDYGTVHYRSPVIDVVYLSTSFSPFVIASIEGVTKVEYSSIGHLTS